MKKLQKKIKNHEIQEQNTGQSHEKQVQKLLDKIDAIQDKFQNQKPSNVTQAFVIFRSMEGQKRALQAFHVDRRLSTRLCSRFMDRSVKYGPRLMNKYQLEVTQATDPDLINFANLGVSNLQRTIFGLMNVLISICILVVSTATVVHFSYFENDQSISEGEKIQTAIILTVLGPVAEFLISNMAIISRKKTVPEETYQDMLSTLITQYVNVVVVMFLVNYRFEGLEDSPGLERFIKYLPFFNG